LLQQDWVTDFSEVAHHILDLLKVQELHEYFQKSAYDLALSIYDLSLNIYALPLSISDLPLSISDLQHI